MPSRSSKTWTSFAKFASSFAEWLRFSATVDLANSTKPLCDGVDLTYHLWPLRLRIVCVLAHPSRGYDFIIAETRPIENIASFASFPLSEELNCRNFVLSAYIQFAGFYYCVPHTRLVGYRVITKLYHDLDNCFAVARCHLVHSYVGKRLAAGLSPLRAFIRLLFVFYHNNLTPKRILTLLMFDFDTKLCLPWSVEKTKSVF